MPADTTEKIHPITGGIKRLSKSAMGKTSINIAASPITSEIRVEPQQQKVDIKTALKQVRLPATVLP